MRVLFFSDHFRPEPSAPAAHVYERARIWARDGHQVTVVCSAPNFPEGKVFPGYRNAWRFVESMDGVRVVRVKTFITRNEGFFLRTLDYLSYGLSAAFFALFEKRPDVVISSSPHLFVPIAGVAHSKLRRTPHVFEIRDLWPASLMPALSLNPGRLYRLLEKVELLLYRHSRRILAFTEAYREDLLSRGVPSGKVDVVINGANLDLFQPRPKDEEILSEFGLRNRVVVGYLGTLGLAHGLENVIEAARLLRNRPVVFFFVGVGAAKEGLQEMVRKHGLDNVVFAPRQLKEEMPRFWSVVDLSLIHLKNNPVFKTVIPSKIFESMAMGIPILYVGPKGEGARIVTSCDSGVHVPPNDPRELARAVAELASDQALRKRMGSSSLAAAPRYSRETQAQASLDVLKRATAPSSDSGFAPT